MKTSKGLVARLLMVGIVCIVVVLISESSGAFCKTANAHGRPRPWAVLGRRDAKSYFRVADAFDYLRLYIASMYIIIGTTMDHRVD